MFCQRTYVFLHVYLVTEKFCFKHQCYTFGRYWWGGSRWGVGGGKF